MITITKGNSTITVSQTILKHQQIQGIVLVKRCLWDDSEPISISDEGSTLVAGIGARLIAEHSVDKIFKEESGIPSDWVDGVKDWPRTTLLQIKKCKDFLHIHL